MIIIQVIAMIFALGMMYTTYLHYKRRDFSTGALVFWMSLWIGFSVLVVFAKEAGELAKELSFVRLMDMVMVVGLAVFGFVTFINYAALSRMERRLEKVVRASALDELEDAEVEHAP